MDGNQATLLPPPPEDADKSLIENLLEITDVPALGSDIFTNARPLWRPPGARGLYGGGVIAQAIAAGSRTVPSPDFVIHSCHCYFLLAGSDTIPLMYHVERVRDGRSFATRTVQVRQRGRCIFTVTMSFVRDTSGTSGAAATKKVSHAAPMPSDALPPEAFGGHDWTLLSIDDKNGKSAQPLPQKPSDPRQGRRYLSPFVELPVVLSSTSTNNDSNGNSNTHDASHLKHARRWTKARDTISPASGHNAHILALAYMSDAHFLSTVTRIHRVWLFPVPPARLTEEQLRRILPYAGGEFPPSFSKSASSSSASIPIASSSASSLSAVSSVFSPSITSNSPSPSSSSTTTAPSPTAEILDYFSQRPRLGMLVSLDHTIYFHNPRRILADDWMFVEMESPWSDDERGLVTQRIFSRDGTLLATCVQEGVIRLDQNGPAPTPSKL